MDFYPSTFKLIMLDVRLSMTMLVGVMAICIVGYYRSPWRKLPPGPPGLPFIGNLLDLKERRIWLTFTKWSKLYGPIIHVNALGQPLIVLNTHKATADLLERRAAIYSDRPPNIVSVDMMTGGNLFALAGSTDVWRRMRKAAREALNKGVIKKDHQPVLLKEAVILASGLIANSVSWSDHIRRATSSAVVAMIYDKEPLSTKDPTIAGLHGIFDRVTKAAMPGAHLVEFFTWMRHIPPRFAAWKRMALESYKSHEEVLRELFEGVRQQMAEGSESPSLSATLIREKERNQLSDVENLWAAGTVCLAGDAPAEFLEWWMAAMIAYPETQKKAQQELDKVVGRERLPSFSDYQKLPYIRAMVKEILRWGPAVPVGVPHRSIQDDWYNGYFIPKHSIVISNMWCMNRNPEIYGSDADHFNPARFLDGNGQMAPAPPDTKEEGHVTYGYGRRSCLGRHVGNDSLFINIAVMLWSMNIECAIDDEGNPTPVDMVECVENGIIVRPVSFGCKVTPRFPDAISMLDSAKEN